jgi:UDP-N-acetylglucosamine 1-carboxyvinyltransferase
MTLMSVLNGKSQIEENIFENRFMHVPELHRFGADIVVIGKSARIKGVERFSGASVIVSDLRAGAALVLAGLVAEGKTIISGVYHIDRGYDMLEKKFRKLGADIRRIHN